MWKQDHHLWQIESFFPTWAFEEQKKKKRPEGMPRRPKKKAGAASGKATPVPAGSDTAAVRATDEKVQAGVNGDKAESTRAMATGVEHGENGDEGGLVHRHQATVEEVDDDE